MCIRDSVNTAGTYTITYNVSDAAGNPATEVTRTVNVVDTFAPKTIYVSALGDGAKDGTTEANAYPQNNFNTALADVSAGDKLIIIGTVKTIGANLTSKSYAFTIEGLDASSTLANVNGGTGRLFTINGPTAADVTFKNLTFSGYNTTLAGGGVFYNNLSLIHI